MNSVCGRCNDDSGVKGKTLLRNKEINKKDYYFFFFFFKTCTATIRDEGGNGRADESVGERWSRKRPVVEASKL